MVCYILKSYHNNLIAMICYFRSQLLIQVIFTIWKINPKVSDCEQILIHINNAGVIETTGIRNGRQ